MQISEKVKLVRVSNNMTQEEFAKEIGISRTHLTNIELGKVKPSQIFINYVSLKFGISKNWLLNDNNDDLGNLNGKDSSILTLIAEKYDLLDDDYKKFIENQILELLEIQKKQSENNKPYPDIPDTLEECLEKYPPTDPDQEDGPDSNIS